MLTVTPRVVLRQPKTCTTRQALTWNPLGKRKRGHPRSTWCRDLEAETTRVRYTWGQLERLAQDRDARRALVGGLCTSRSQSNDDEDNDDDDDDDDDDDAAVDDGNDDDDDDDADDDNTDDDNDDDDDDDNDNDDDDDDDDDDDSNVLNLPPQWPSGEEHSSKRGAIRGSVPC